MLPLVSYVEFVGLFQLKLYILFGIFINNIRMWLYISNLAKLLYNFTYFSLLYRLQIQNVSRKRYGTIICRTVVQVSELQLAKFKWQEITLTTTVMQL